MQPDSSDERPGTDQLTASLPPKTQGKMVMPVLAVSAVVGCAVLGVLLYRASERERSLRAGISICEYQLDGEQAARRRVEMEGDQLQNAIEWTRGELRAATNDRDTAKRELAATRFELSECGESLESTMDIARSHRDKRDEIASAIRIGLSGVADIPRKGFIFEDGSDLESEYRKVIKEYNDLVGRFNAAVERSNDLGEVLNRVIRILP